MKTRGGWRESSKGHEISVESIHERTNAKLMAIAAGQPTRARTIDHVAATDLEDR